MLQKSVFFLIFNKKKIFAFLLKQYYFYRRNYGNNYFSLLYCWNINQNIAGRYSGIYYCMYYFGVKILIVIV